MQEECEDLSHGVRLKVQRGEVGEWHDRDRVEQQELPHAFISQLKCERERDHQKNRQVRFDHVADDV